MSKILLPDYIVISDGIDIDGRLGIIGKCIADNFADLPAKTYFTGYTLENGSTGTTSDDGAEYIMDSSGDWHKINKSPYADVYTKSEIDTLLAAYYTKTETDNLLSPISSGLASVIQANAEQDPYIYALVGQSSLNLIDSSVWDGQTTAGSGYICQDLPINLPAGNYVWKMKRDGNTTTTISVKDASNNVLYTTTRGSGVNDITQPFTISADAAKVSIYAGYSINYTDNMIFKDLTA